MNPLVIAVRRKYFLVPYSSLHFVVRAFTIEDGWNVRFLYYNNLEFINYRLAPFSFACHILASVGRTCRSPFTKDDRCSALLYYDYFLTFPAEVKYIWSRRFTVSTILYICCRYALLANLLFLLAISNVLSKVNFAITRWYGTKGWSYLSISMRVTYLHYGTCLLFQLQSLVHCRRVSQRCGTSCCP